MKIMLYFFSHKCYPTLPFWDISSNLYNSGLSVYTSNISSFFNILTVFGSINLFFCVDSVCDDNFLDFSVIVNFLLGISLELLVLKTWTTYYLPMNCNNK